MEQNKGRTALVMGVIMMILGAVALVISLAHPRAAGEPPPGSVSTTLPPATGTVQRVDDRADELARELKAAQERLSAAEQRLTIERGANDGIRKEINEIRLARQDLEARVQSIAAERELEKKAAAAIQAALDKANADLAKLQADGAAAAEKAKADLAVAAAAAKAELDKARADAAAQLTAAKTEAEAALTRARAEAADFAAKAKAEVEKLAEEIIRLKAQPGAAPAPTAAPPAPAAAPAAPAAPAPNK